MIEDILRAKYEKCLDGLDIYENKGSLKLSRIIVKQECRDSGLGTQVMNDLIEYADNNNKIIVLTPASDFGGNKNRLIQFYKRFGFKPNKGHYKSFEFQDSMIRYPKLNENIKPIIKKLLREGLLTENESCDCCKYFDMNSVSRYDGLENPMYFIFDKWEMSQIKYISPKQYIYNIARGFGVSYEDALAHINDDNVKKYAEDMKKGAKFPIGYYKDGENSQEGRHRAMALMLIGCDIMPVVVIRSLNKDEINKLALAFKDKSKEELDSIFKKMGYKGISDLDFRSLKNYIEYKL